MRDPRPPRHLQPLEGGQRPAVVERPLHWSRREIEALIHQFFASPFGMAQRDHDRHELLVQIVDVALRISGDPTRWDGRLVTAVLVAELPHQPQVPGGDRRQVPDLLRGFVGFCAAIRDLDEHDADEAIAMVAHWSDDWNRSPLLTFDPWSAERRALDELRVEVGTVERLWSLDTNPLPDEPFDGRALAPDAADAVAEVLALIDHGCTVLTDPELRHAARRLTARVATADAAVLVDQPSRAVSAAVLVWLVARANGAFGPGRSRVGDLMGHLGLRQGSPAGWARAYLRAAGLREHGGRGRLTLGPELLTSAYRRSIIEQRDHCQRVIGEDDGLHDVLQIAHDAGRDSGAPTTGERAPAPRRAR